MSTHSDDDPEWDSQRMKIIGLGESSIRKSYYPELQQRLQELLAKNEELNAAYEELTSTQEELQQNYEELSRREKELSASERKVRTILEASPDMIWEMDTGGIFTYVSPQSFSTLGFTPADLIGRSLFSLIPEDWVQGVRDAFAEELQKNEKLFTVEVPFVHCNGYRILMELRSTCVPDGAGTLTGFSGIAYDITERRETERRMRLVAISVDRSRDGMFWLDRNARFYSVNEAACSLLGYAREELLGMSLHEIDPAFPRKAWESHLAELRRRGSIMFESRHRARDGRMIPVEVTGNYFLFEGLEGSFTVVRDISERRRAENALKALKGHLQTIYEGSPDMIYIHDKNGRIIDINKNVVTTLGYSLDEIQKLSPEQTSAAGHTSAMAFTQLKKALAEGSADFEWVSRKRNGDEFPVEIRLRKLELVTEEGEPAIHIMAIVRDITERKLAEQTVQQARKKLNLLNTVTFQDIQTAAFSLSAYHELVNTLVTDQKAKIFLTKEVQLIQKITSSLDFARHYQEMGIHPAKWQNMNQVFLFAISHLDFLKMTHHLDLGTLEIYGDPLLEKAVLNLMENVLRHGVKATEVTLRYQEKADGLDLIIEDNGVGIPREEKNMIFDRGYGKDTGLGLFLVREILSITGMTIRETGSEGKGARFEIHVPAGVYRFGTPG
jgi:PAS domain S-box-containing protein